MHDIFAGLGSVPIVKNCDLGPEMAEMDTDRGLDSLIIHDMKTKKIISVKEVSIDFDDFTSPFTL